MCSKGIFLCLIVVAGTWAKPADEGDLNLKSIFRTPKDFSKANLDHFEILERSNFEDKKDEVSKIETRHAEPSKTEDKADRSRATAQVMLRIGGEDIHDCNRVILPTQPCLKDTFFTQEQPQQMLFNNPYNPQSYGAYPCFAQQPYSFPGYYYNPSPVQNYLPSYQAINNQVVQTDLVPKPGDTLTTIETSTGRVEECAEQTKEFVEAAKQQMMVEGHNHFNNQGQRVEVVHEHQNAPEEKVYVSRPATTHTQVVENCDRHPTQEVHTTEYSETTSRPERLPSKVEYVEVNLADVEKNCHDAPKEECSCQKSSEKNPVMVSYPEERTTSSSQHEIISEYPSTTSASLCDSCSQERNPNTPFGHRFSKDMDSLFKIVDDSHQCHHHNHGHTEIINVHSEQAPRKVETIVSHPASQTHMMEIVNPCHEAQEVIQERTPSSRTVTIESPCTKTVTVQQTELKKEPVMADSQIEWSTQTASTEPCQQREMVTENSFSNTIESPTDTQIIQVTNNPSNAQREEPICHSEWSVRKVYTNPSPQREVVHTFKTWPQHPTPPEMVQVHPTRLETAEASCAAEEVNMQKPMVYVSDCDSKRDGQVSMEVTKYENEHPKVHVEGFKASTGWGYYSNPIKSVYFKRPTVVESIKVSNPQVPVVEHTEYMEPEKMVWDACHHGAPIKEHVKIAHPWSSIVETIKIPTQAKQHTTVLTNWAPHHKVSEPHIYKVVPKYDIIPRGDIKTLNIPDLVPTNQYLKINSMCPEKAISHKKFLAVEKLPVLKNEWFMRTWPFWRNVSVQRELPWLPSDFSLCGACAKYKEWEE